MIYKILPKEAKHVGNNIIMHLRKCKLRIWIPMTADRFGATHRAIGSSNYPVCVGQGTTQAHGISRHKASDTHIINKNQVLHKKITIYEHLDISSLSLVNTNSS